MGLFSISWGNGIYWTTPEVAETQYRNHFSVDLFDIVQHVYIPW